MVENSTVETYAVVCFIACVKLTLGAHFRLIISVLLCYTAV